MGSPARAAEQRDAIPHLRPDGLRHQLEQLHARGNAVQASSGNVFRDLGLPDADELMAKAELARAIQQLIEKRSLTQTEAAHLLAKAAGLDNV